MKDMTETTLAPTVTSGPGPSVADIRLSRLAAPPAPRIYNGVNWTGLWTLYLK